MELNDAAIEKVLTALSELWEPLIEAIDEFISLFADAISDLLNVTEIAALIEREYLDTLNAIEQRKRERAKWRREVTRTLKPLMLDKRSKIHRCRNAI